MIIEGFWWFVGAIVICGWHTVFGIRPWRRELRAHAAWWRKYEAGAIARHEAFMAALNAEPELPLDDDEIEDDEIDDDEDKRL